MIEKVYAYVVEATKEHLCEKGNSLYISEQLKLSRNMVSIPQSAIFTGAFD